MKLHEFTDRLYAMGGIEQEEKRSRRLNEDINSDERLNQIREELLTLDSSFEIIEDKDWGWIYNDDWVYGDITYVQITYPISDYGMKAFPQNFNVQVVDGDPINSLDRGFDNLSDAIDYAPIQFKKYFLNESLTEARNPENDEDKEKAMNSARAKRTAKKNESLNLNESKQGLVDYFYKLTSTFDMDPDEQVDYLLGYMSESELLDAIDDFKEYMDIDDEDIM